MSMTRLTACPVCGAECENYQGNCNSPSWRFKCGAMVRLENGKILRSLSCPATLDTALDALNAQPAKDAAL